MEKPPDARGEQIPLPLQVPSAPLTFTALVVLVPLALGLTFLAAEDARRRLLAVSAWATAAPFLIYAARLMSRRLYQTPDGLELRSPGSARLVRWEDVQSLRFWTTGPKQPAGHVELTTAGKGLRLVFDLDVFYRVMPELTRLCPRAAVTDSNEGSVRGPSGSRRPADAGLLAAAVGSELRRQRLRAGSSIAVGLLVPVGATAMLFERPRSTADSLAIVAVSIVAVLIGASGVWRLRRVSGRLKATLRQAGR